MKFIIIWTAMTIGLNPISSQYSVNIEGSTLGADISVRVGESIIYADLDVEIGYNVISEDFSVGFTRNRYGADVIISKNSFSADFTVNISSSLYADIDIDIEEHQINEDISIEIKESGYADYLIYNESDLLSKEQLAVALLPIINAHLDYKFDDVPYWSEGKGIGKPEDIFEPVYYCCPSLDHWISNKEDGIITLDYQSIWLVYEEDQYISDLWLLTEKILIKPTNVYGHYYLIKYNEYLETSESVRAICVKN